MIYCKGTQMNMQELYRG